MSGRVAPGHSLPCGGGLVEQPLDLGVVGGLAAIEDRHLPLAEERGTGGDRHRIAGHLGLGREAQVGLDPFVRCQANRLDPAHLHAAEHHRVADTHPAGGPEPGRGQGARPAGGDLAEPDGGRDNHHQGHQHRHPDREFIAAAHSGRPSMN